MTTLPDDLIGQTHRLLRDGESLASVGFGEDLPGCAAFYLSGPSSSASIIMRYGSQLEKIFYETITHKLPVSVSLDNRKVYVGYAWRVPSLDPRRLEDYAVRLLPPLCPLLARFLFGDCATSAYSGAA
jgi:hypothetical protein